MDVWPGETGLWPGGEWRGVSEVGEKLGRKPETQKPGRSMFVMSSAGSFFPTS